MFEQYLWYFIGAIIVLIIIATIVIYNGIIAAENNAKRGWSDVIAYERNKLKLIPQFEKLCQSYQGYEGDVQTKITNLRQTLAKLDKNEINPDNLKKTQILTSELQKGLNLQVENYPDLKANSVYLRLMQDWRETQENVTAAISIYNNTVAVFNNKIQMFPSGTINSMFLHKKVLQNFDDSDAEKNFDYQPNFD